MKTEHISIVVALVAVVIALGAYSYPAPVQPPLGGAGCNGGNCTDYDAVNTAEGYYVDDSAIISGTGNITNATSGTFQVPTTNTATSTTKVGCVQTTATSTATPIHLEFNTTSSTSTINGASSGIVAWKYGACPI